MKKNRKLIYLMEWVMLSILLLTGCQKESTDVVTFFNYGANIDNETLKEFKKEYGIEVKMDEFDDMDTMYVKLANSDVAYDVVLVSDALLPQMIENGLLQPLNHELLPNLEQMDENYLNLSIDPENQYSVPYMFGTIGIIYDTDVVKEDVDSWDILWNPEYKDQIFMFDTYRDTIGVALKRLGYSMNTTNPEELEAAKQSLLEQRELVNPKYGVDNGTTMIAVGETAINMIWSGEGLNLQDEYPNLRYVIPKEGVNFWIDSLCIPKNASNVENAHKLINFLSDKDSALRIASEIGYTTPNRFAQLEQLPHILNNPNAYMPDELMALSEIYLPLSPEVKQLYNNVWIQVKVNL